MNNCINELMKMIQMQKELDQFILENNGITTYPEDNVSMALIDEFGELTHELKGTWCYWKKQCKPVVPQKVLEEYVDCLHFMMSLFNYNKLFVIKAYHDYEGKDWSELIELPLCALINYALNYQHKAQGLTYLFAIGHKLGISWQEIKNEYMKKHDENIARQKRGY